VKQLGIISEQSFAIEVWREARETGIDAIILTEPDPEKLMVEIRSSGVGTPGVKTLGSGKWAELLHRAAIVALTEPNPLHSEYNQLPPFNKPKDLGIHDSSPYPVVIFCTSNRKEVDRFNRNRARAVRAIIHAYADYQLLGKHL
jgi:hypothetical protein